MRVRATADVKRNIVARIVAAYLLNDGNVSLFL